MSESHEALLECNFPDSGCDKNAYFGKGKLEFNK